MRINGGFPCKITVTEDIEEKKIEDDTCIFAKVYILIDKFYDKRK